MRMRKKPNLIPRMERCAEYLITDPEAWRGRWREKLSPNCALRLELGCGKGRFTCETAAAEPDVLFVAVERVPDAMVIAMERAKAVGLANVFFIDADVARLRDYFSPDEVERIYINFCDPWPNVASPIPVFWSSTAMSSVTAARSTSKPTTAVSLSGPSSSFPGRITLFQR